MHRSLMRAGATILVDLRSRLQNKTAEPVQSKLPGRTYRPPPGSGQRLKQLLHLSPAHTARLSESPRRGPGWRAKAWLVDGRHPVPLGAPALLPWPPLPVLPPPLHRIWPNHCPSFHLPPMIILRKHFQLRDILEPSRPKKRPSCQALTAPRMIVGVVPFVTVTCLTFPAT
jgi:hypothetical protein